MVAPVIAAAPLISAGAGALLGGAVSALGGFLGNRSARKESARNRRFQEKMSSTAHQREVKDLRAAGLNPILSATGGAGASTPGGSMAQQQNPLADVPHSAMSAARLGAELKLITNQGNKVSSETANNAITNSILENQNTVSAFDAKMAEYKYKLATESEPFLQTIWKGTKILSKKGVDTLHEYNNNSMFDQAKRALFPQQQKSMTHAQMSSKATQSFLKQLKKSKKGKK